MSLPHLPLATAAAAAALALLQTGLMMHVGFGRLRTATGLGDGGDEGLLRRIRMHGNLAENGALFLVLLGLAEISGDWGMAVPAIAAAFVICRLAHAFGLSRGSGPNPFRFVGAMGTATVMIALAALLAVSVVSRGGVFAHG
jgi:uncharacterized membrane protein YecN with MAPEG domain